MEGGEEGERCHLLRDALDSIALTAAKWQKIPISRLISTQLLY